MGIFNSTEGHCATLKPFNFVFDSSPKMPLACLICKSAVFVSERLLSTLTSMYYSKNFSNLKNQKIYQILLF